ncbi:MAG TPA: glycosyltransferase [Casimicrobiaceae bacterium]|nr:glycosyltransferase [Casimicrobiaceae bacterium]
MQPLVSVIVRSMARPTLGAALDSIGMQDHSSVDVVVVGASGPSHPDPPDRVGMHPVRLVRSERQASRPQAANIGLAAASGEWITFLDDDDILYPDHVSSLVGARGRAGAAQLIYSSALARLSDGSTLPLGQPFALHQLYERNFIHLSMALFSRELVALGCRFDESLEILQDWDFFLQCAQHTRFHFEPRATFEWRADIGTAGTGAGANRDDARFAAFRDRIYAKWAQRRDALAERVAGDLQRAASLANAGDFAAGETICREVLDYSENDPFALNLLAMMQRSSGRIRDARSTQELACAVRPGDSSFAYNLALLCRDLGDLEAARAHCRRAASGTPASEPAMRLLRSLTS